PPQMGLDGDGGLRWNYVPEEADKVYTISWKDGDTDPTARFTFYYIDHSFADAVSYQQVPLVGTVVRDVQGRDADGVYASCTCTPNPDLGVSCDDGGTRWCDNSIDWDTSQVPDGVYWLVATNTDPPYFVYNQSSAPVRVSHGASKPPVAIVLRP